MRFKSIITMFAKINFSIKIQETNTRYETPNKLNIDQRESTLFPTQDLLTLSRKMMLFFYN